MTIQVVPASQTLAAAYKQFSAHGVAALEFEIYNVADFFGRWFKLTRDEQGRSPYGELASPQITRDLQEQGVMLGDQVLVARIPTFTPTLKVRVVSPLTEENQRLAGVRLETQNADRLALMA